MAVNFVHKSVFAVSFLIGVVFLVGAMAETSEDLSKKTEAALEKLRSEDFEERDAAMKDLWELGSEALPLWEEVVDGPDPEVAARATEVRKQLLMGVEPGTPPEIRNLLKRFHEARGGNRMEVFEELIRAEAYDYALRLPKIEEDPEVLEAITERIDELLPTMVRKRLVEGQDEEAERLLQGWQTEVGNLIYASLLWSQGKLEKAAEELAKDETEEGRRRYLVFLRVLGNAEKVFGEAGRQGEFEVASQAGVLLGDPLPGLRMLEGEGRMNRFTQSYFNLATKRWGREDYRAELQFFAQERREGEGLLSQARDVFYRLGEMELAGDLALENAEALASHFYLLEEPLKVLEAYGVNDASLPEVWLKERAHRAAEEVAENGDFGTLQELITLAQFFENHGEPEKAARIIQAFAFSVDEEDRPVVWHENLAGFAFSAREGFALSVPRLFEGLNEDERGSFYKAVIAENTSEEVAEWLVPQLLELRKDAPVETQARLIFSVLDKTLYVPELELDAFLIELEQVVAKMEDKELAGNSLRHLFRHAIQRSDSPAVLRLEKICEQKGINHGWNYLFSLNHIYRGEWEAALERWSAYTDRDLAYKNWPPNLFFTSLILERLGKREEAEKVRVRAWKLGLHQPEFLEAVVSHLEIFGEFGRAYEVSRVAFLCLSGEDLDMSRFFQRALAEHDWKTAAAAGEVYLSRSGGRLTAWGAVQTRCLTDMSRGFAELSGGNAAGVGMVVVAHDMMLGNGVHADYLFPGLREFGEMGVHDRLYESSDQRIRAVLEAFPNSHNDLNTSAWLSSRAVRDLDRAHDNVQKAIEAFPNSAYLDTMAEVWFARGDREKAIEWSRKSLVAEASDSTLLRQYLRYQNDPLPGGTGEGEKAEEAEEAEGVEESGAEEER